MKRTVYMCFAEWFHELGSTHGPFKIYTSVDEFESLHIDKGCTAIPLVLSATKLRKRKKK